MRHIIFDCDPGIDDAVALLLAFRAPELDIRAVAPVAGNVALDHTCPNALKVLALGGADLPVCPGADGPLLGAVREAAEVHGEDGLLGWSMPAPRAVPSGERAWDAVRREAGSFPGELELLATGPLTNLAVAFTKYPDLPGLLKRVVLMGGGVTFGNATPAAEFNLYADPEAADVVFRSGAPLALCPLDVCHRAYLTADELDRLEALGTPQAAFAAAAGRQELRWAAPYGRPGAPMHDPTALLYLLYPEIFTVRRCWVGAECAGTHTRGKLVTDVYSDAKSTPNADLVLDVDRAAYVEKFFGLMGRYGKEA